MTAALRVLVCGTNFGRFYLDAVRVAGPRLELAGVLSRGGAASRALAEREAVPHYTDVAAVPSDVDIACVAVGSTISGGAGTELARALLERGVHVIQEHPVHADELTACLKAARAAGVQYRVTSHYPHVPAVAAFVAAAGRLRAEQQPLFVDAAGPVHLLYPMVDLLGRALGGFRPWRFADPPDLPDELVRLAGPHPLRSLAGVVAGVPVSLRVHNQLDPADRDNHAVLWPRVSIGAEGGVLTLADLHGPVLWNPKLHTDRDAEHRFVLAGPGTEHLDHVSASVLPGTEAVSFRDIFHQMWPRAIAAALAEFADAVADGRDPLRSAQFDLTATRVWADIAARIGPPDVVRPAAPTVLGIDRIAPPAVERQPESYSPTAEFFELAAADHVRAHSAPAVLAALSGYDATQGPIADLGAGTGLLTEAVAKAHPAAEVIACEPAVGMRAVLTSRVVADPDLRRRVTVTDDAAPEGWLPDRLGAALVCGVAGHLPQDRRRRLWRELASRLAPGGVVVVELMTVDEPVEIPAVRLASATVGDQCYEWWFSATPDPDAPGSDPAVRLRSEWRAQRAGTPPRVVSDEYRWHTVDLAAVAEDAADAGLVAEEIEQSPGGTPMCLLRLEGTTR